VHLDDPRIRQRANPGVGGGLSVNKMRQMTFHGSGR